MKARRDNRAEQASARGSRALRAAEVRIALEADNMDVMQLAQALILCGLPYRQTKERQISRKARLGDGSTVTVTFTALSTEAEMPFGLRPHPAPLPARQGRQERQPLRLLGHRQGVHGADGHEGNRRQAYADRR